MNEFNEIPNVGKMADEKKFAWYIVSTYNKNEQVVERELRNKLRQPEFRDDFIDCVIIGEYHVEEKELKSGKVKVTERFENTFPSYIFVRANLTPELWYAIRNARFVTGIIGSHGGGAEPTAVEESVMNPLLLNIGRKDLVVRGDVRLQRGDHVVVNDGPFVGKTGVVSKLDNAKYVVTLIVDDFTDNATLTIDVDQVDVLK